MGNAAAKLGTINFEKEFKSDCAERKRIGRGEHARKKGGGRTCRLPSDNLTKKQWEEKCSEVFSVNLKKMMTWGDYKKLDEKYQATYLQYLYDMGGYHNTIADMFNLLEGNISAADIQKEFSKLGINRPLRWIDDPEKANESFQKWILDQIPDTKKEEDPNIIKEDSMKTPNTRVKLTEEQKEQATPNKFFKALARYVSLNKAHVVRNYNMVQKDTAIILNHINYKSTRDLHTNPTKIHLIMNRTKFVEWYLGQPRKALLFQEELTKNGIKTAYLEEENYTLRIKFYQESKIPDGFKNPEVAVLAIDIDNIPEPYRKEICNLLSSRYGSKSMQELFGYAENIKKKYAQNKKKVEDKKMESAPTPEIHEEDEFNSRVKFQAALLESFKVNGLSELNAVAFDIHGTAHIKGTKEEIMQKIERYIDTLGLTDLKIEF